MTTDKTTAEIEEVRRGLAKYPEIAFAYLHGSSLTSESPRDLDIAIFLYDAAYAELSEKRDVHMGFVIPIEMHLESIIGRKTDVQILNHAPLSFRHRVVQQGILILDNDVDRRCRFEYLSRYPYFDFKNRRLTYLSEALS